MPVFIESLKMLQKNLNNNQISKKMRSACKIVIMQY